MTVPHCLKCGGGYVCAQCDFPLRKAHLRLASSDRVVAGSAESYSPELRAYLDALRARTPYEFTFERGPRGGAMLDFGGLVRLECFVPYVDAEGILPFAPMALAGDVVHDIERSERWLCEARLCDCERPTGWKLTKPILRALLGGVSSAFLHEHGHQLPGRLACWCTCVSTLPFLRDCLFNPAFKFPTRDASRTARRSITARRSNCKPPHPHSRGPRR